MRPEQITHDPNLVWWCFPSWAFLLYELSGSIFTRSDSQEISKAPFSLSQRSPSWALDLGPCPLHYEQKWLQKEFLSSESSLTWVWFRETSWTYEALFIHLITREDWADCMSVLFHTSSVFSVSFHTCGTGNACSPSDLFAAINFFASACMRLESAPFKWKCVSMWMKSCQGEKCRIGRGDLSLLCDEECQWTHSIHSWCFCSDTKCLKCQFRLLSRWESSRESCSQSHSAVVPLFY